MNLLSDFPIDVLINIFRTFLLAVNLREFDSACCSSLLRGSFLKLLTNDGFVLQSLAHLDHYETKYASSKWLFLRSIKCSRYMFVDLDCFIFLPQIQTFRHITTAEFHLVTWHRWDRNENDAFMSTAVFLNKCTRLESFKVSFCNGLVMQNIVLNLSKELMAQIKSFELTTSNPEMNSLMMRHIGDYCHNLLSVKFWSKSSSSYKNNTTFSDDVIHVLQNCTSITSITANLIKTQISDELFDTICLGGWQLKNLNLTFPHHHGSVHSMVKFINSLSVNLKSMFMTAEKVDYYDLHENCCMQYFRDISRLFVVGSFAGVCFWEVFQNISCNSIFSNLLSMELIDITTQPSDTSLSSFIGNNKFLTELTIDDRLGGFGSFSGGTLLTLVKGLKCLSRLQLECSDISAVDIVKIFTVEGSNLKECFIKSCRALTFDAVETIFRTNKTLELFTVWRCPLVHKSDTCSSYLQALNPTLKFKCIVDHGW
jgi:hypothetical protein